MICIMLVDDSTFMRNITRKLLSDFDDISIETEAKNGLELLEKLTDSIDVVLLDIEMPKLNGLEALELINKERKRTPVIMFSSLTKKGAEETIKALELGAFDFIEKPKNPIELNKKQNEIAEKIRAASKTKKGRFTRNFSSLGEPKPELNKAIFGKKNSNEPKTNNSVTNLVLIGCSTGGPKALKDIIPMFPADLNAAILIVQHMPAGDFTKSLANSLNKQSALEVFEAVDGQKIENGCAYIAPGGSQMKINSLGQIVIREEPPESGHAPSVDYMFREVFEKKGRLNLIPVVLTGMGGDGSKSAKILSDNNIEIIVESEETCAVFGMPRKVIEIGAKHTIKQLQEIPNSIINKLK